MGEYSGYVGWPCSRAKPPTLRQELSPSLCADGWPDVCSVAVCSDRRYPRRSLPIHVSLNEGSHPGHYEIVAPLGTRGKGEVSRARHTKLGREVAIKILPDELSRGVESRIWEDRKADDPGSSMPARRVRRDDWVFGGSFPAARRSC